MANEIRWTAPMLGLILLLAALPLLAGAPWAHLEASREVVLSLQTASNLRAGELALRWSPDLAGGHGAPFFLFQAPAGYYLPGVLLLLGVPGPWAVLGAFLASLAATACLAYLVGRDLSGPAGGWVLTTLYLFAPLSLAARQSPTAALSTSTGLIWPVLILWAGRRFYRRGLRSDAALVATGFALLILTDTHLAALLGPLLLLYLVGFAPEADRRQRRRGILLLATVIAAGATSFFWLPAWAERGYLEDAAVVGGVASGGLLAPLGSWLGAGLAVGLGALALPRLWRSALPERRWALLSVILGGLSLAPGAPAGAGLVLAAPLAGALLMAGPAKGVRGPARILAPLALLVLLGAPASMSAGPAPERQAAWDVPQGFRPRSSQVPPAPRTAALLPAPTGCRLDQEKSSPALHFFDAVCSETAEMQTGLHFYPGWTVSIDNRRVEPGVEPGTGTLNIALAAGPQRVKVSFEHTRLRRWTRFASLVTLVLGLALPLAGRHPDIRVESG